MDGGGGWLGQAAMEASGGSSASQSFSGTPRLRCGHLQSQSVPPGPRGLCPEEAAWDRAGNPGSLPRRPAPLRDAGGGEHAPAGQGLHRELLRRC